jgi:hypothetical protein
MEVLIKTEFDALWGILKCPTPTEADQCWEWCFAVLEAFRAPENDECSLERAYQTIIQKTGNSSHDFSSPDKVKVMWAIFAVLCWTSALLAPIDDTGTTDQTRDTDRITVQISSKICSANGIKRPFYKMVRAFRHIPGDSRPYVGADSVAVDNPARFEDVLYESNLNYSALVTIGRVKLDWVYDLSSHLAFDRRRRTLCIFRFPSYCVAKLLGGCQFQNEER